MKKDFKAAFNLFQQAAKQPATRKIYNFETKNVGKAEAEHALGLSYQNGIYVEKNMIFTISPLARF